MRERQNSAKIYPRAGFAGQKAEVIEQLKIHSNLIGQRIRTKNSNHSPLGGGGGTVRILIKTNVVGEKPQSLYIPCIPTGSIPWGKPVRISTYLQ